MDYRCYSNGSQVRLRRAQTRFGAVNRTATVGSPPSARRRGLLLPSTAEDRPPSPSPRALFPRYTEAYSDVPSDLMKSVYHFGAVFVACDGLTKHTHPRRFDKRWILEERHEVRIPATDRTVKLTPWATRPDLLGPSAGQKFTVFFFYYLLHLRSHVKRSSSWTEADATGGNTV